MNKDDAAAGAGPLACCLWLSNYIASVGCLTPHASTTSTKAFPSCAAELTSSAHRPSMCLAYIGLMAVRYCLRSFLALKNHPYNSSIYIIHIPLHSIYINVVSATSFRTYKHCSVCGCSDATVCKGGVGHPPQDFWQQILAATSFARFGKCWTNYIPCYAPGGPGRHIINQRSCYSLSRRTC